MRCLRPLLARRSTRRPPALLLATVIAALAGCGGGGEAATVPGSAAERRPPAAGTTAAADAAKQAARERYVKQVEPAFRHLPEIEALSARVGEAKSLSEITRAISKAERAFAPTARRIEAVEPPAEVVFLHRRLVEVSGGFALELQSARANAQAGNTEGASAIGSAADAYRTVLAELAAQFEAQGYRGLQ